ncbi:unnamed protein product [Adineta steineri]|uniref:RRM domain-containing protein n=1 Tax=Adineta steineri TaxID=433720 RepID=A0A819J0R2_9BILA|nr:unnamed protein product [Adineta steineri]CAF3926604.1 unnamed protein product [Adineta steineri]
MGDRQLFIGNLCNVPIESLRPYCEKYGTILDLSLNRDKDNNVYHCFAFLTFQSSSSVIQFMSKRPHLINGEEVFVKRALSRTTATIPERLVVTNRLVVIDSTRYDRRILRNYFQKLGHIKNFDYENGRIDYDDYDVVDRILVARPHYIHDEEVYVTKFIPTEEDDVDDQPDRNILPNIEEEEEEEEEEGEVEEDENLTMKYKYLEKQFEDYKETKEKEIKLLRKELEKTKEELSDITQIKLDKIIKNQQLYHSQLLHHLLPKSDSIHAQLCDDFLRSTPNKKRKTSLTLTDNEYELL